MYEKMHKETNCSVFSNRADIEYFRFEEDFIEANIRCIPMIVRFKLDAAGIKLKLKEWSFFSGEERLLLATAPCTIPQELEAYRVLLTKLIFRYTHMQPTILPVETMPAWKNRDEISSRALLSMFELEDCLITIDQWARLTDLQRFALLKLSRPGHENKNFPKAIQEFGLKT